jgi:hypothetical protein
VGLIQRDTWRCGFLVLPFRLIECDAVHTFTNVDVHRSMHQYIFFFFSSTTLYEFWLAQLFLSIVSSPGPSVSNFSLPCFLDHWPCPFHLISCRATICNSVCMICSSISCIFPGWSIVSTFYVPKYIFCFLFLGTRFGHLLFSCPAFHNWAFLAFWVFFRGKVAGLAPNPQPGGPGCLCSSGFYPLTCPAWVALPVATLPLA